MGVCSSRAPASRCVVTANSKKTDIRKQGLESIKDEVVKANLMGVSRKMDKKGWVDAQGRKGKVLGCLPLLPHQHVLHRFYFTVCMFLGCTTSTRRSIRDHFIRDHLFWCGQPLAFYQSQRSVYPLVAVWMSARVCRLA